MKYMFLKSREVIKIDILKYVFIYYVLVLIYVLLNKNSVILNDCLGLGSIMECSSMEIILKIVSVTLIVYLTYKIYSFDIIQNIENIYLRSNSRKLLLLNIIIILLFIIMIRLVLLFIVNFFIKVNLSIILLDIIYYCFISLSSILILNLLVRKRYIFKLLFMIVIVFTTYFSLVNIDILYLIIFSFIFLIIMFITYSLLELIDFIKC